MAPWGTQLRFNLHPLLIYTLSIKTGRSSSQNEIYDIGANILDLQCLNYSQNQTFCKSIIPEDFESSRPLLSFASVKTRFKAFWDVFFENLHATLDSQLTKHLTEKAPAGRLKPEACLCLVPKTKYMTLGPKF